MSTYNYRCKFCETGFVQERRFIKHRCKMMKRNDEMRTPEGQAAWLYYQKWMKAYKRRVNNPDSFLNSRHYGAFIKFANFSVKVHLPDTDIYIRLMCKRDISPVLWTTDEAYSAYLEHVDIMVDPTKNASITITTLFNLADEYEVDVSEIFNHITPNELIQLLRQRRLSPWIILKCPKFKTFYANRMTGEEKIIAESVIRVRYWQERFKQQPETVELMKKFVKELNL